MIYKITSSASVDAIKNEMSDHAKAVGFGVLNTYEFKEILQGKGFPIERDITVFELCNPQKAQKALSAFPEISVYLPCRLSVYEEAGATTMATIGIGDMLAATETSEAFELEMKIVFDTIVALMHSWDS